MKNQGKEFVVSYLLHIFTNWLLLVLTNNQKLVNTLIIDTTTFLPGIAFLIF